MCESHHLPVLHSSRSLAGERPSPSVHLLAHCRHLVALNPSLWAEVGDGTSRSIHWWTHQRVLPSDDNEYHAWIPVLSDLLLIQIW